MNANPGDLVVCVKRGPWVYESGAPAGVGPVFGDVLRVRRIGLSGQRPVYWLDGWSGEDITDSYCASRFRRLNDEPDNAELIERIKSCKPQRVSA